MCLITIQANTAHEDRRAIMILIMPAFEHAACPIWDSAADQRHLSPAARNFGRASLRGVNVLGMKMIVDLTLPPARNLKG
jgi:hypothetical protein